MHQPISEIYRRILRFRQEMWVSGKYIVFSIEPYNIDFVIVFEVNGKEGFIKESFLGAGKNYERCDKGNIHICVGL